MRKLFNDIGDFAASRTAEQWLHEHGFSVGYQENNAPRGILRGDVLIMKWRNLSGKEKAELHGQMTGDMRHGPVAVTINDEVMQANAVAA